MNLYLDSDSVLTCYFAFLCKLMHLTIISLFFFFTLSGVTIILFSHSGFHLRPAVYEQLLDMLETIKTICYSNWYTVYM